MKKLTIVFTLLYAPAFLFAQGVGIGIKGGVNFANMDIKDVSTSSITSFHIGGYVNLNLSDKFGITPEILWTAQGSEIQSAELNTDYISIPVMVRFKPVSLLSLEAGPVFNFLINAEYDGADFKDQLKNNEFGFGLGAGVHLPLGFNGGIRYVLGFTNISDVDEDIKSRTFQIYVGWTIFGAK
ncbi:MAG TPA: porin family protein [Cyclobacteriaceae bacterium]|nr:porin family protein [Cyclobacteriaceae bacterium]